MADPGGELRPPLVSEIHGTPAAVPADAELLPGAAQRPRPLPSPVAAPSLAASQPPATPSTPNTVPATISTLFLFELVVKLTTAVLLFLVRLL